MARRRQRCGNLIERKSFCRPEAHDSDAVMSVVGNTDGAERLVHFFEAIHCHPLDCAGDLRSILTLATLTQGTKGRTVVAGRPTWQACGHFCNNIGTFRDKVTYTAHRYSEPTGVTTMTTIIPRDEVAALEAERDLLRAQLAKARQARAPVHP